MVFLHRFLSMVLILVVLALFMFFTALWSLHYWGTDCEVSQVFKLSKSIQLNGQNYLGVYDVAVTPIAPNQIAQMCNLYALTSVKYLNILDKRVWLISLGDYEFAYYETPQTKFLLWVLAGAGVLLMGASYLLFKEKGA